MYTELCDCPISTRVRNIFTIAVSLNLWIFQLGKNNCVTHNFISSTERRWPTKFYYETYLDLGCSRGQLNFSVICLTLESAEVLPVFPDNFIQRPTKLSNTFICHVSVSSLQWFWRKKFKIHISIINIKTWVPFNSTKNSDTLTAQNQKSHEY